MREHQAKPSSSFIPVLRLQQAQAQAQAALPRQAVQPRSVKPARPEILLTQTDVDRNPALQFRYSYQQALRGELPSQTQALQANPRTPEEQAEAEQALQFRQAYQQALRGELPSQVQSVLPTNPAQADSGTEELEEQETQAKGNWQQKADLGSIFSSPGSLPTGVMAQYENLMPGVDLSQVSLHQGSEVDAALQAAGLHGLTDGENVAVSSKAPADTLPHELGHIAQRQEAGFSLTEGSRAGYEQDADGIAARLMANQPVERFEDSVQGKCNECEKQDVAQGMKIEAAEHPGRLQAQARAEGKAIAAKPLQSSNKQIEQAAQINPEMQAQTAMTQAFAAAAPVVVFGPVGLTIAVGLAGLTIIVWLNNGGWQEIGRITDAIAKGINRVLEELGEILNRAGEAAMEQLDQIEDYIEEYIFPMAAQGNVADTGIMEEVSAMISDGIAGDICEALAILMKQAKQIKDKGRIRRIKATQKAKGCRHSRHS
jgi:hypothetical protein